MIEEFEHEGIFWKPDDPDSVYSGRLLYSPDEFTRLVLLDGFEENYDIFDKSKSQVEVIHGNLENGQKITLSGNLRTTSSASFPGTMSESYVCSKAFFGAHIIDLSRFYPKECVFSLTLLEEWLGHRPVHIDNLPTKNGFNLKFITPDSVVLDIPLIKSKIYSKMTRYPDLSSTSIKLSWKSWLNVVPDEPMHYDEYISIVCKIQNLVSLCLGEKTYVTSFQLVPNETNPEEKARKENIELYYQQKFNIRLTKKSPIFAGIRLHDFGKNPESGLKEWFRLYDEVDTVLDSLIIAYLSGEYIDLKYLLIMQALEGFHRMQFGSSDIKISCFKPIRKKMIDTLSDNLPEKFRERIEQRLRFAHEFTLKDRLIGLCKKYYNDEYNDTINLDNNSIADAAKMRHVLTHIDGRTDNKRPNSEKLYYSLSKIGRFLMIIVFEEMGIPREVIIERLKQDRIFISERA